MIGYAVLLLCALNLGLLAYVVLRLPYAASLPFAMALAQKEAELIILRQTVVEAKRAFAFAQQAERQREAEKGVAEGR